MPDLFSQGNAAFSQAVLLLAAGICIGIGIGGLLIGHEIYLRRRALRVSGTIVGVRQDKPGMYFNVYWYTLPGGEAIEATSSSGSNLARGRETGRSVELFALPDHPESVSEARSPAEEIAGVVLILFGAVPAYFALTLWPVTWLTGVMLLGGIGFLGTRLAASIIPAEVRQSPQDWKASRRAARRARLAAIPVQRIEDILAERRR